MTPRRPRRACPVCCADRGVDLLHTQEFVLAAEHLLPATYDVVACGDCGFVYADAAASQVVFDKYYAEVSKYEADYTGEHSEMFAARAAWIGQALNDAAASVADVGCGNGELLRALRNIGFHDLFALDPSQDCVEALREDGLGGMVGSLLSAPVERQFDGLVLSGVLEHIWDVPGAMRAAVAMLKQDGCLFVFVPDATRYADYDAVPFDYFNVEHVNHFDEVSLINMGLMYGLGVVELRKAVMTLAETQQPVIYCAFRKAAGTRGDWKSHSADAIRRYVTQTGRHRADDALLRALRSRRERIVVWGAGNFTSRLLATSELAECDILFFIDNDRHKQGTRVAGRQVVAPSGITNLDKDITILVAASVFQRDIVAEVNAMGLENKVIVLGEGRI